ncbi:T9SS type B sorting domain-containing protein [Flavobacterium ardleyense]|uniref:T9SS type B sorting domain-containing protein n=1 Tax=Flavobacterium ardleyense TaxID=2038737 RepID=A0ABW5ZCL8_9FLAO
MNKTVSIFIFLFFSIIMYAQGGASSCAELAANPLAYQSCATNVPFTSATGSNSERYSTSCIPNRFTAPTWFFIEIDTPGNVVLQISQENLSGVGTDVDFVLWGPFRNLDNICSQLDERKEVDCSYLPDAIETVRIPYSNSGDLYILVVDNYSRQPGKIRISQTGGNGATNCDFLSSVSLQNPDNSPLTVLNYCKPEVKEIVAKIDITDFPGVPSNLRFNYTWFRNNIQINAVSNSTLSKNSLNVSDSGIYKVVTTAYDITVNPTGNLTGLRVSEVSTNLKFHIKPAVQISNANTVCLTDNPTLTSTITNNTDLNPSVDILSYQWFLNNNPITGATTTSFAPTQPGDYYIKATNTPCSSTDSNVIRIITNPNVQISSDRIICESDSFTITSTNANASLNNTLTYQWYKDGAVIAGATNATYTVNSSNQNLNTPSQYYLETTEQGTCTNISNTVEITINALPIVNTVSTIFEQCDYIDNTLDGIAETNLSQLYDYFTNSTAGLTLNFYTDIALTQLITNSTNYLNTASPFLQTIYVNLINENLIPNCTSLNTGSFVLQINPTSVANYPDIPAICPELGQNYGYIDFNAHRILIKNTYFPSAAVAISFHLNTSDASTGLNELTNLSQIPTGTTTVYTRVISAVSKSCEGIGTFEVIVNQAPVQNAIENEELCLLENFFLNTKDAEVLLGQDPTVIVSYFNSFENAKDNIAIINKNNASALTLGTSTIFARLYDTLTQCLSIVSFDLNVFPNPTAVAPSPIKICGDVTATFNLNARINQITNGNTNYQVLYYANNADLIAGTPITDPETYTSISTTIICEVTDPTNSSCKTLVDLELIVMSFPVSNSNTTPIEICNDSGFDYFDLTVRELELAGPTPVASIDFKYYKDLSEALASGSINHIVSPNNFRNTTVNFQKIYVKLNSKTNIDSETGLPCFKILEIDLYVRPFPENNLLVEPYTICIDQQNNITYPITIKTSLNSTDYTFQWYTDNDATNGNEIIGETSSSFTTANVGLYSVKVTNISNAANCASVFNFSTKNSVVPNVVTVTPNELIAFGVENTIVANAIPASTDYLYSIDGTNFQESNIFTNIPPGDYTLTATNKYGCGDVSDAFTVIDYPKFFTPNADGFNDTWNINISTALDVALIRIFDRYGKLITVITPDNEGWNGTLNSKPLPSTDYWFTIEYTKNNIKKEFRGHFSLIR